MPSPTFSALLSTVSLYMDSQRAKGLIERQLETLKLTPDNLSKANLKDVSKYVTAAAKLYITVPEKRTEMSDRIQAL